MADGALAVAPLPELKKSSVQAQRRAVEQAAAAVGRLWAERAATATVRSKLQKAAHHLGQAATLLSGAEKKLHDPVPAFAKCARCGDDQLHRCISAHVEDEHFRASLVQLPLRPAALLPGAEFQAAQLERLIAGLEVACKAVREALLVPSKVEQALEALRLEAVADRPLGSVADFHGVAAQYAEPGQTLYSRLDGAFRVFAAILRSALATPKD